jgi:hypothetical protein
MGRVCMCGCVGGGGDGEGGAGSFRRPIKDESGRCVPWPQWAPISSIIALASASVSKGGHCWLCSYAAIPRWRLGTSSHRGHMLRVLCIDSVYMADIGMETDQQGDCILQLVQ